MKELELIDFYDCTYHTKEEAVGCFWKKKISNTINKDDVFITKEFSSFHGWWNIYVVVDRKFKTEM